MKKTKTILEINTTNYASTGNITLNIAKKAREEGYKVFTACKASKESFKYNYDNQIYIGYRYERILSSFLCSLTGLRDHFNIIGTYDFVRKIDKLDPDLIHLHVLHDDFINIGILFNYLKKKSIPVIWTFHDCNAITGKCPSFDMIGCHKWENCCNRCPQLNKHPKSYIDVTEYIWKKKKRLFTSLKSLTIITPSNWLYENVKKSYFSDFPIRVINNGINLDIFKPIESNIKNQYNIQDKFLILGIANVWGKEKGLDVFIKLSKQLPQKYQIMLVGTNEAVDKLLPENIISIHRTYNQNELVKIYSAADIFVNTTREDNFPTVNIEALACGTPVLTFNTGGSPEIIDTSCGSVVEKNDIDSLISEIKRICDEKPYSENACIHRAEQFDMNDAFGRYIDLYREILDD